MSTLTSFNHKTVQLNRFRSGSRSSLSTEEECFWAFTCVVDIFSLQMQNIALLILWWLASNLKLAYPSEMYCNLSLMIGSSVIDGGIARAPRCPVSLPLLPSAGEAHRIFEMCFDHQSGEKALIFYWPEMKRIRWKKAFCKRLSRFTGDVCFFLSLKKEETGIFKRYIPKRKALGFEAFQMFCWEARCSMSEFRKSMNSCHQPPSIFLALTFFNISCISFTEQTQMPDNNPVEHGHTRSGTVSLSHIDYVCFIRGIGATRTLQLPAQLVVIMV